MVVVAGDVTRIATLDFPGLIDALAEGFRGGLTAPTRHHHTIARSGEAAATVHTGTSSEIGAAHDAVLAWCAAQRRELTGVRWEIYGDPDPHTGHFDVAVYWQLAVTRP